MEEPSDAHYSKLGKSSTRENDVHIHDRNAFSNLSPPEDTYNVVFLSFVLGGAGFLFPYNSFIMAMDYFKERYAGLPVVFDMSLVYIVVAFLTVLANNLLVETFSLNARINFGYIMSFLTLMFVVLCEVWWEAFGPSSYSINLAAVAVVAVGCTVQQSSFYGYTSMLPAKYTQAVMVGESASGVFTSFVRALTRFIIPEIRGSTIYFFTISVTAVGSCFTMYHIIRRTDFIQFYIALCERAKTRITLEPTEDAGLIETTDAQFGVLKIQNSPPPTTNALSFANPVYEPSAPAPTYKVEDVVIRGRASLSTGGGLSGIRRGIQARWEITKAIHPYMLAICMVYFATLSLYPGIASEVVSCAYGSWMPIIMMTIFNVADLLGKMLATSLRQWTGMQLVRCSLVRMVLIPLMLMCVTPRSRPYLQMELFPFSLGLLLGLSNGVLGSLPMILAPSKVDDRHRELTGNIMTLLYNFGLTAGSLMAYAFESALDPVEMHVCPQKSTYNRMVQRAVENVTMGTPLLTTTLLSTVLPSATTTTTMSNVAFANTTLEPNQ